MTISLAPRLVCALFLALTAAACQTASVSTTTVDPKILEAGGRAAKYDAIIRAEARKHGVPVKLAHAVISVESNYNARARGRAGEIGLMQIKPQTARGEGFRGSAKALYDPKTNITYGMRYLAGAHKKAGGDVCGTILRYNAGHFAKRMNPISSRYCSKVKRLLARG
ncbi:lytic transglycosylase domain-containing protein [Stappia sp.]|uniref:lytic transglycosylase domain-containing protein n=1 Tax=Stappia sp. TaxID=1870903 RepID=UPI003D0F8A7E